MPNSRKPTILLSLAGGALALTGCTSKLERQLASFEAPIPYHTMPVVDRFDGDSEQSEGGAPTEPPGPASSNRTQQDVLDWFHGSVRARVSESPTETLRSIEAQVIAAPGDTRFGIYAGRFDQEFKTSDLEVETRRAMASLGQILRSGKSTLFYGELQVGRQESDFSEGIDMDADRTLFGARAGFADKNTGTRFMLGFNLGDGKYDAELLSGYESKGDLESFFLTTEFSQRLLSSGTKTPTQGAFDPNYELGRNTTQALHLTLNLMAGKTEFGELLTQDSYRLSLGLPYIVNMTETSRDANGNIYADGQVLTVIPFVDHQNSESDSDISLRTTDVEKTRLGFKVKCQINKYVGIFANGGYQWTKIDVEDPGQGVNETMNEDGAFGGVGIEVKW